MISIVSGMLVTSLSMMHTYDDGIETYKLEDGHFSTNSEISVADLQKIADQEDSGTAKATIYKQYFYNLITHLKVIAIIPSVSTKTARR